MFHVTHYGKAFQLIYLLLVRMVIQYFAVYILHNNSAAF